MATETISLQQGLQDKGYEEWVGEMIGMREVLRQFSNVSTNDVVGMRAPYLKPGRNTQYKVSEWGGSGRCAVIRRNAFNAGEITINRQRVCVGL